MKKIKIYLVADEMEVKQDELEISNFIRDLNDKFSKQDVYFKLITDDDLEEIDGNEIKSSEMFFLIFCKKMDDETIKKFNIAYNSFIEENTPKISTYIKEINEEKDESLTQFLTRLGDELGHYYSIYNNVDTIKLNVVLKLKALGIGEEEIETKDGKLYINDREILSLDKIPIIFNNKDLAELKKELNKLEDEYFTLKAKLSEDDDNEELFEKFSKISAKRNEIKEAIFDLEKKIVELESSFVKISNEGKMSIRQIHAKKALEEGNIEAAKEILDVDSIVEEANKKIELKALKDQDIMVNINEMLQRIDTLELDRKNKDRFSEIENCYDIIIDIEKKGGLYPKTLVGYAEYLSAQRKCSKAIKFAEQFIKYVEFKGEIENLEDVVAAYDILITDSSRLNDNEKLWDYIEKVKPYIDKLENKRLKARVYNNISLAYMSIDEYDEASKYLKKSIEIKEKINASAYSLIVSYKNLITICINQRNFGEASKYVLKALEIVQQKNLSGSKIDDLHTVSNIFESAVTIHLNRAEYDKAKECALISLEYREKLYNINAEKYSYYLACSYKDMALVAQATEDDEEAEEYFKKAIDLMEKCEEKDQELMQIIYGQLAVIYMGQDKYDLSKKYFELSIEIVKKLLEKGLVEYESTLADLYFNQGFLYDFINEEEKADENYEKAIQMLEKLADKDIYRYGEQLAEKYELLAEFYTDELEDELLAEHLKEEFLEKAKKIREKISR